jgi:iron only hydrogenase large subunit-like protein
MGREHSYTITLDNNNSEKEAVQFLIDSDKNFINPDKDSRKLIMELLGIEKKFIRAFDLVLIPGHTNIEKVIELNQSSEIILVELKTTKKKLLNNPRGFFFGATENEFDLARKFENKFRFCFVSLHPESKSYKLLTLKELNEIIKTKRVQYQINLKN